MHKHLSEIQSEIMHEAHDDGKCSKILGRVLLGEVKKKYMFSVPARFLF